MIGAWIWLAGAVAVLPPARRNAVPPRHPSTPGRPADPARTARIGAALAALAVGCACVAALGVVHGGLAALVAAPVTVRALRAVARRPVAGAVDRSVALPLDLAAAALRSGRPLGAALTLAAPAAGDDSRVLLSRVAGLLGLGAPPERAWSLVPARHPLAPLAAAAVRSAASGIKLADAFERHAAEIRAEASTASRARAERAGITAMAPLAACFLPSFVCLGIVPVVVGIAGRALGSLQ